MIRTTATISRGPTRSPRTRTPSTSRRTRPSASTGCTRVSGAWVSAAIWSGQPTSESAVAPTQTGLAIRWAIRDGRRARSAGRAAGLDCLECVAGLVATGRGERQREAESELAVHEWHHPAIDGPLLRRRGRRRGRLVVPRARPGRAGRRELLGLPRRIDRPDAVALTFDDGPSSRGTPAVLEALRSGASDGDLLSLRRAGRAVSGAGAEIAAAGHAVALHGYRHRNMLRLAPRTFVDDLERGIAAIEDAVGRRPEIYTGPRTASSAIRGCWR